jgi:hypothetical protein
MNNKTNVPLIHVQIEYHVYDTLKDVSVNIYSNFSKPARSPIYRLITEQKVSFFLHACNRPLRPIN